MAVEFQLNPPPDTVNPKLEDSESEVIEVLWQGQSR